MTSLDLQKIKKYAEICRKAGPDAHMALQAEHAMEILQDAIRYRWLRDNSVLRVMGGELHDPVQVSELNKALDEEIAEWEARK